MRVRVAYTVDVDDDTRRLIRRWYGQKGLATRDEVREWFRHKGEDGGNIVLADEAWSEREEAKYGDASAPSNEELREADRREGLYTGED